MNFKTEENNVVIYLHPNGEKDRFASVQRGDGMINVYGAWGTWELVELLDQVRQKLLDDGWKLKWEKVIPI